MAQSCWDYKNCPQDRRSTCPAFTQKAGRTCWLVAGTLCGGKVQGVYAEKIGNCQKCEFYIKVKAREI